MRAFLRKYYYINYTINTNFSMVLWLKKMFHTSKKEISIRYSEQFYLYTITSRLRV